MQGFYIAQRTFEGASNDIYTNFEAARAYVLKGRSGYDRPLGRSSKIIYDRPVDSPVNAHDGRIRIRLFQTDIIILHADGSTEFQTNGWFTPTTSSWMAKNRLFQVGSAYDRHHPGRWRVAYWPRMASYDDWTEGHRRCDYLFEDGITFTKRGRCINGELLAPLQDREARERERRLHMKHDALSVSWKAVKRLRTGLPLATDNCHGDGGDWPSIKRHLNNRSVCGDLVRTAVAGYLGRRGLDSRNWRDWLGFTFREDDTPIVGGPHFSPAVEPYVRKAVYEHLTSAIG